MTNMVIAMFLFLLVGCFQIINNEIPIRRYNEVHTGPNIPLGGLNDGRIKEAYQSGIACAVKIPAMAPIASGRITEMQSLIKFFESIFFSNNNDVKFTE